MDATHRLNEDVFKGIYRGLCFPEFL